MLEYLCYGCVGTYYLTFCVFAGYTCYQERQEAQEARMREYYEINQREPPNIEMMPEREFSRINRLDPIIEELEESF
tara:strand:- start:127 stop:357 length:231 start_codon:yes stop_codon:yes gene_type:complete